MTVTRHEPDFHDASEMPLLPPDPAEAAPAPGVVPGEEPAPEPAAPAAKPSRLRALDAFRGLTIALMLLVNNVALDTATPEQLQHAGWNRGIHLADLVFPWFLFAVGVSIPFSEASARAKGLPGWRHDVKILLRAASLVALGCLVDSSIQHRPLFTLGVLQIIGLAYLGAAFLYPLPRARRLIATFLLLAGYWAFIKYIPAPGLGAGAFEETRNIIFYLNRTHFNAVGLWGVTAAVPTAALALLGTQVGDLLRSKALAEQKRLAALLLAGLALVAAGFLWNHSLPYNKALWTPAYVLMTAGLGTVLLGLLHLVVDTAGWWHWSYPLLVLGSNAILAYLAPILVKLYILESWQLSLHGVKLTVEQWLLATAKAHYGAVPGGWTYTLGYLLAWWVVLWFFHRKKVFLRV